MFFSVYSLCMDIMSCTNCAQDFKELHSLMAVVYSTETCRNLGGRKCGWWSLCLRLTVLAFECCRILVTERGRKGFVIAQPNTTRPPPAIRWQLEEQFSSCRSLHCNCWIIQGLTIPHQPTWWRLDIKVSTDSPKLRTFLVNQSWVS